MSITRAIALFLFRWLLAGCIIALALPMYADAIGVAAADAGQMSSLVGIATMGGLVTALLVGALNWLHVRDIAIHNASQEHLVLEEAQQLRATRERAQAIFELITSISGTLDHHRVMEAAQSIGTLNLRDDIGDDVRLISSVLLFQGDEAQLRVITARGLTPTDQNVKVTGQRGVLGLALQQAQPVFGGAAINDPELRYFAAFQDAKSILAIPLGAGYDVYGVIVFGCEQPNAFTDEHVELMSALGKQATLSLQNAVLYQNLLREKEKIVEVEEDARKKLARDLHDGPTQSVATIAMRANFIRRLIERQPQQALEELWKVEDIARRTTKEIRHMLFTMRPLVLENKGLVAALHQLAEKMQETHSTTVVVEAATDVELHLDTNEQGVLFYIVDEAVNNARKHAASDKIYVRLYRRDNFIVTEVEDHGKGFDLEDVDQGYDQRGSLGLVNMRERAGLIEGRLHIQSVPGQGTKITVLVPIDTTGVLGHKHEAVPPLELQSQREARQSMGPVRPISRPTRPKTPSSSPPRRPITHLRPPKSRGKQATPSSQPASPKRSIPSSMSRPQNPPPRKSPASKPTSRPVTKRIKPADESTEQSKKSSRPSRPSKPSEPSKPEQDNRD